MMFDYRKILVAYIAHVGWQEGITFLGENADLVCGLSEEERAELNRLDEEARLFFSAGYNASEK